MQIQFEESVSHIKQKLWERTQEYEKKRDTLEAQLAKAVKEYAEKQAQVAAKVELVKRELANFKEMALDLTPAEVQLYQFLNMVERQRHDDEQELRKCEDRINALGAAIKMNESLKRQKADQYALADAGNAEEIAQWTQLLQIDLDPQPGEGLHIKFLDKQKQFLLCKSDNLYRLYQVSEGGSRREIPANFDGNLAKLFLRLRDS